MKTYHKVLLGLGIVTAATYVGLATYQPKVPVAVVHNACDPTLWSHVYHPQRLQVKQACTTVSGTIAAIKIEKDGDYHIRLTLDPQYKNLLTPANKNQNGDMVLEPICVNPVTQADAISSCKGFKSNVKIPKVGQHVIVTGSYVLDNQHGGWAEIHPVTSIKLY
ncbi:MAG TPA: hypothetical protein VF974_06670 [Patescibacteria group bacterium]